MTITAVTAGQAAAGMIPAAAAPAVPDPGWCQFGRSDRCLVDQADGSRFHMSTPTDVPTADGTGLLDVQLIQVDEEFEAGDTQVCVNVGRGVGEAAAELTPEQALYLAEVLRDYALRAAGSKGVEMPIELVRFGDELLTGSEWNRVEILTVDGWCCGTPPIDNHPHLVKVNTDAHSEDDEAHSFARGDLVRVRRAFLDDAALVQHLAEQMRIRAAIDRVNEADRAGGQ